MATLSELIEQGVARMRLPFWNQHAYLQPREIGPWADLYDVGGHETVLIALCDRDDRWVPADAETEF